MASTILGNSVGTTNNYSASYPRKRSNVVNDAKGTRAKCAGTFACEDAMDGNNMLTTSSNTYS